MLWVGWGWPRSLKVASFNIAVLCTSEVCIPIPDYPPKEDNHPQVAGGWVVVGKRAHVKSDTSLRINFILYFVFSREKKAKKLESRPVCTTQIRITSLTKVHGRN